MYSDLTLREQLVAVAKEYAWAGDLSLARVSNIVMGAGHVLPRLERGESDITTATFERALAWFSNNWPEHASWPLGIRRPAQNEAA